MRNRRSTDLAAAHLAAIVEGSEDAIYSTAVRVTFPACFDASAQAVAGRAEPRLGRGETVLVVEDEPAVRVIAAELLTRAGDNVIQAGAAEAALALSMDGSPELLLTDVVMPGMSGSELGEALRDRHPASASSSCRATPTTS